MLALLAILAAAAWLLPLRKTPAAHRTDAETRKIITPLPATRPQNSNTDFPPGLMSHTDPEALKTLADPATSRLIQWSLDRFAEKPDTQEALETLNSLCKTIRNTPPESQAEVTAAILLFLQSERDTPTGLPFTVGPNGILSLSPSLRVALLDLIASLDPISSALVSSSVMNQSPSADEFAIALRNLTWNDLEGDLSQGIYDRLNQMIQTEKWTQSPSSGFLEALDTAVFLGDEPSFMAVVDLNARSPDPDESRTGRALSMVLDRMVVRDPGLLVRFYDASPELSGLSINQRASLMSRLDPTDPPQARLFDSYLNQIADHPEELEYFAGLFPNGNQFQGHWLVSSPDPTLTIAQRRDKDRMILAGLDAMRTQDFPEPVQAALARIRQRLSHHLSEE